MCVSHDPRTVYRQYYRGGVRSRSQARQSLEELIREDIDLTSQFEAKQRNDSPVGYDSARWSAMLHPCLVEVGTSVWRRGGWFVVAFGQVREVSASRLRVREGGAPRPC